MFFSLLCEFGGLWWFWPIDFLSFENHLVKAGDYVSLSSGEDAVAVRYWRLRILNNCMNFPCNKENSLDKLIVTVHWKPHVNELFRKRLNELRNLKLPEFFLFHYHECFGCLGRLPELIRIGCLISHFSELVTCLLGSVRRRRLIKLIVSVFMLELFLASNIHYCFNKSESLVK